MQDVQTYKPLFAEVIIPLALPVNYTWLIPPRFAALVQPGSRVEVELGRSKRYAGIITSLHHKAPAAFDPKPVLNVLNPEPIVYQEQLQLWEWMAKYYMCSQGEVMAAALPAHFKLSSETILVFNEEAGDDFTSLNNDEYMLAEALLLKKELRIAEAEEILDTNHVYPVITSLVQKRICYIWEALKETFSPRQETFVELAAAYKEESALETLLNTDKKLQRADKQLALLLSYLHLARTTGFILKQDLLKKSGATDAQLKGLVEKGILLTEKKSVDRVQYLPKTIRIDFELTPAQVRAYDAIKSSFITKDVCLLHGVTSSGKTEIYIKLIAEAMAMGKQVLYMLPEIALTSQTIRRLQKHFGGNIGIYHSKFSQNERIEIWNKLKSGELRILLGARSALFLPFKELGLIICDEEHDSSYKQTEPAPRYHGRDAAVYMASLFPQAKVLLGSATPSLESYYNGVKGKYGLVTLQQRYGDFKLPHIELIDTRKHKVAGDSIITHPLQEAMLAVLQKKKQVILFQNRRGYTPYQRCINCGWIPRCKHCDVSLTYHKFHNKLLCHYCGTKYPPMHSCAVCGSHDFVQKQFGTERIEEDLKLLFPDINTGRMDVDTVRGKYAHDQLIQNFEQLKIDVLVGTQMVVKGLHFTNVGLVGILDADGILSFADFRVNERAFQLMEQVSGRTGRTDDSGLVLIQTSQPEHPVLKQVQQHDYIAMYATEIVNREQFLYPPFTRIIKLNFKHKLKDVVRDAAVTFAGLLKTKYEPYIVGPSEPVVNRIRNQYIMEMLLKLPRNGHFIEQCKKDILENIAILHQERKFRPVVIIPDVDCI